MLNKMKNNFNKFNIKDSDYNFVLDEICESNRKILLLLCSVFCMIFGVLISLSFLNVGIKTNDRPIFITTFFLAAFFVFLVKKTSSKNHKGILVATYFIIFLTMIYGLVVSFRSPEQYTASFIGLMGLTFMTFIDKPKRLALVNVLGALICLGMVCVHKADSVRSADITNILSFTALSLIGGYFTVNMKIHGYVMDKLQEEDIEQSKQKLNKKEIEAYQLLTAVKASYAMVVSVNLTKNTYKLLGEDSFVTDGDDLEGNFDEVIEIHASKVVERHRKLYYDTFSRQALLNAFNSGKKTVYLEYQQYDENGEAHWLGTHTMFTVSSESSDITEITLSQNIDERVKKEEESKAVLQAERDKSEQARKAKTDFLFQMSHDIRTPMNAIIGYTNFIKSSDDLNKIHNDYAIKLETAGQQLLMLINDVLEMSRIESGKLTLNRELQDICSVISNVMSVMKIQAEERRVELISEFAVQNSMVYCDQNYLSRIIINLLSNAIKFTPSGGKVTVSLSQKPVNSDDYVVFEFKVSDTGIGISPEFLQRVFEPFEREQTSTVSGMQGTGLGLAIVKRIVEAAGNTISVESKQNEGTVFTINFTLNHAKEPTITKIDDTNNNVRTPNFDEISDYFKGKRILLVEDNEFNLDIARTLLESAGFSVETAVDGNIALNKVIAAPTEDYYDLILMDVQMPVMNGYDAAKAIRALPDNRANTLIIAVTANAFDTDKEDAFNAGMNAHIAKPIDIKILYKTLWDILFEK